MKTSILIAGGGVVGSATAWALAQRGVSDVLVVDLDLAGLYASSELNAGGARATWWQYVNVATCASTLDFFRTHREELGFRERGYLWLYEDPELFSQARDKLSMQNEFGLGVEVLRPQEVAKRFPVLDEAPARLVGATFSPRDGLVNPNAVRQWYRREAESMGARFLNRHYVSGATSVRERGSRRRVASAEVVELDFDDPTDREGAIHRVLTTHSIHPELIRSVRRIECDVLVNCLGAWSPIFSSKIGIGDVTKPTRRQICLVRVQHENPSVLKALSELGMVVDASDLYFHPEGGDILAGYSIPEEAPGFDFHYDGQSFFVERVWPRLSACASVFERCQQVRGWAGLYAVTPDRSGIAGAVEGFTNLFEAHSFTGRGVMQSHGIATAVAELIDQGRATLDIGLLSRERFVDRARWLVEDLHV